MSAKDSTTISASEETAPQALEEQETQPLDAAEADTEPTLGAVTKRRRTAKIDLVLAEAKDIALAGILEITKEEAIGPVHHLRGEEERLTTHLFECALPGYRGWFWFATLSRVPRSKQATICEVGLIPGDDALLAPEWVPWAERLKNIKPEELEELEEIEDFDELEELETAEEEVEEAESVEEEDEENLD